MNPWPAVLAGGALLLGVFAGRELRSFERAAAAEIANRLSGPGKKVELYADFAGPINLLAGHISTARITARDFTVDGLPLFTEPERSKRGVIDTLQIRLYNFTLRGLRIEELRSDIRQSRYDLGLAMKQKKVRLSKSGTGPGYVRVNAKALEDFILLKYSEIKSIKVTLRKYKLFVEGFGDFVLFKSNFYVISDLKPYNGTQLYLDNAIVFLDGRRVRDGSERALLNNLNPVIDEDKDLRLFGALKIEKVKIREGYLELEGASSIPPSR